MTRERLNNRRETDTLIIGYKGQNYTASVSYFENGRVAEAFIQCGKPGSELEAVARDTAVILSLALQFGCPLNVLREAITRNDDGVAAGPIGALLDLINDRATT